jgi:hypothetical protein
MSCYGIKCVSINAVDKAAFIYHAKRHGVQKDHKFSNYTLNAVRRRRQRCSACFPLRHLYVFVHLLGQLTEDVHLCYVYSIEDMATALHGDYVVHCRCLCSFLGEQKQDVHVLIVACRCLRTSWASRRRMCNSYLHDIQHTPTPLHDASVWCLLWPAGVRALPG